MENPTLLKPLRGRAKVRRFATYDVEAVRWEHPYAVGFYDGRHYTDFYSDPPTFPLDPKKPPPSYPCIDAALRFMLQPKYAGMWIYAHNGGNYDHLFLLRRLMAPEWLGKYRVEVVPTGSTIISIEVHERDIGEHEPGCSQLMCPGCATKENKHGLLKWTFVDSVKLFPVKLDEVGETFKLGKKVELPMSYDDLALPANRPLMRNYLKQDCVLLYEAVDRMQRTINDLGGEVGVTLPATALGLWRRRYLSEDIHTNRHWRACPEFGKEYKKGMQPAGSCRNCLHQFIRRAYFGGRSEIFRMQFVSKEWVDEAHRELFDPKTTKARGKELSAQIQALGDVEPLRGTAKLWDINSHYPACMLEAMPVGPAIEAEGLTEENVYTNARRLVGIVDCDVFIPEDCYLPPLPVVARFDKRGRLLPEDKAKSIPGKLIFPTGYLRGTWDTAELTLLKRVGGKILTTRKSVWFETANVFATFIKAMYRFRDKRHPGWNKGMDFIAKILMNSLYGKFAMREDRKKILFAPPTELLKKDWRESGLKCVDLDADVWTQNVKVSASYIVPQLSVHVTALARARLWEILQGVLKKGGRIYYTDTDSVVGWGADLPSSPSLGDLKLEDEISRAEFVLPKLYLLETAKPNTKKKREQNIKVKAKGMGPGIRVVDKTEDDEGDSSEERAGQLSEKEFVDLVRKGVPLQRHRLTKLNEGLAALVKKAGTFPTVKPVAKRIQSKYDKRLILDDLNTAPRHLKMF